MRDMKENCFRYWLEQRTYRLSTIGNKWSRVKRVEKHYGDLDELYAQDQLNDLLEELNYTTADERKGKPNPSRIKPINGKIRTNLADYKNAVRIYREFRLESDCVNVDQKNKKTRQSSENISQRSSRNLFEPPNLSDDGALALCKIAVPHCKMPHSEVVKKLNGPVFPVIRNYGRRFEKDTKDGSRIMYDDNRAARWAFLWSHDLGSTAHPGNGWYFAHVWEKPGDPESYTNVANLLMIPAGLASLSDKHGPLAPYLRYHAKQVYGWQPNDDAIEKPPGYDELEWEYLDPYPEPMNAIRKRIEKSQEKCARVLRGLLGW